jgi:N-sulfoglucosamine sulfohydrolase
MRFAVRHTVQAVVVIGLLLAVLPKSASAESPNIVVFLADDFDQLDGSAYSDRKVRTPNMQRLADEGMTFTHAFVASPSCAPSRAALLTGLMPARNGVEPNHASPRPETLKLPRLFREAGYEVASFGKVAHYGHAHKYDIENAQFEKFHDHRGIDAAVDFLAARDGSKPVCLFVGTNWPHRPWPDDAGGYDPDAVDVPPMHADTKETRTWRARYYHAVTKADNDLGRIYNAARTHLGDNTIFVFTSDHGAQWPFGKWNLYDAGIRVPMIVKWPEVIKAGSTSDAMVSWIDLLPTLLDAAGVTVPATGLEDGKIDGRSFLSVLQGEATEHRDRIFTTHSGDGKMNVYPIRSVRSDRWKYIWNLHPEFQHTTHVDRAQAEDEVGYFRSWERAAAAGDEVAAGLIHRYRERPEEELYDLDADPFEQHNLAGEAEYLKIRNDMRTELETWMQTQGDGKTVFNEPILLKQE